MSRRGFLILLAVAAAALSVTIFGFRPSPSTTQPQPSATTSMAESQVGMILTSKAFNNDGYIPSKYTCDGDNVSPPLSWSMAPDQTKTYALIMVDIDAPSGAFTHWAIFNIPASENSLLENIPEKETLPDGSTQGRNELGKNGYTGPCPPSGTHRYQFHLYALDTVLDLPPSVTRQDVQKAVEDHVLAEAELTGLYARL